ncbi:hypothetical protein KBD33_00340 [Candidatus Gracilibacteria bacterium]|nr:hypothetical protein [Candidatus Gracilibacteria bacterium]
MDLITLSTGLILGLLIGMFIMKLSFIFEGKNMRKATLKGSRNQILGEVYEKVLPALPNFPYAPKDMVFIGKGCDYIIFDGLTEGQLREIIFLELKSGRAVMTYNEKAIQAIIDKKRVRFSEYRIESIMNKE